MYQRAADVENGRFVPVGYTAEPAGDAVAHPPLSIPPEKTAERTQEAAEHPGTFSEINTLFSRLKLSSMDTGDLLLAAILYVTLHDTGDDDLFWIAAVLFLTGKGKRDNTFL